MGDAWRVLNRRVAEFDLVFKRGLWLLDGDLIKGLRGTTWDRSWVTLQWARRETRLAAWMGGMDWVRRESEAEHVGI